MFCCSSLFRSSFFVFDVPNEIRITYDLIWKATGMLFRELLQRKVGNMRRMFRLSDARHKDIDLREYEDEILEIADRILPGKNPKVCQNYFMTDEQTQGERVRLGRELSKSPRLKQYGKKVTCFRLFEGKRVEQKKLFT